MENKMNNKNNIYSDANIAEETYEEIMDRRIDKEDIQEVSEEEIEQANELINPDPNSLDRG